MQQSGEDQPRVAFVHAAARFHYALAVAVQRAGMLDRMYTEWFVTPSSAAERVSKLVRLFKRDLGQRMLERANPYIDPAKVVRRSTVPILVAQRLARQKLTGRYESLTRVMIKSAKATLRKGFGDANIVMAFLRDNHPSLFEGARAMGLATVGDQIIAPAAIEYEELTKQFDRWPQWQRVEWFDYLPKIAEMERKCWAQLDHVTCGSDYVKQGLISQGVEADRVSVLPYPLDVENYPFIDRRRGTAGRGATEPVTVGFVGHVHLRKGAPYFVEVAKRLRGKNIRFVMVGPIYLEPTVVDAHRNVVDFVGAVARSQVKQWLRRFDVLLFPSTCEGSASAVMEAMATGLPVVTSANSGTVARDGVEGFITPYDDVEAMAQQIERLAGDEELRHEMGRAASRRAGTFSLDWYSREIGGVFLRLIAQRHKAAAPVVHSHETQAVGEPTPQYS